MNKKTLMALVGLGIGQIGYAQEGGLNSGDNEVLGAETNAENNGATVPQNTNPIPKIKKPSNSISVLNPEDYSMPSLTPECEQWMDENTPYIEDTYCTPADKKVIAKTECGTAGMNWYLDRITFDESNDPRRDFNNWSCETVDLENTVDLTFRKFFCDGADENVCVYTEPSANQAPVVSSEMNKLSVQKKEGTVDYVFSIADPNGDSWDAKAILIAGKGTENETTADLSTLLKIEGDNVVLPLDSNLKAGEYEVSIVAVDEHGAASEPTTLAYTITDNLPPVVTLSGNTLLVEKREGTKDYALKINDPNDGDTWVANAAIKGDTTVDISEKLTVDGENVTLALDTNLPAGSYEVLLVGTDNHGAVSKPAVLKYTITEKSGHTPSPVDGAKAVAPKAEQTIDLRLGYSGMFQPAFDQQSHGVLASAAFPLGESRFKLVPGVRYGVLSGGAAPGNKTKPLDETDRAGSEYIESIPGPNGEVVDLEMRYNETSTGTKVTSYNSPDNGNDLQGQLYVEFPGLETNKEEGANFALIPQAGFYAGGTWGQESSGSWTATRDYTTESSLWTVDSAGNEELFQQLDPVTDTQTTNGGANQRISGSGYGGLGARVLGDVTFNNGVGLYAQGDLGVRFTGNGATFDGGFGAGVTYQFPKKKDE